MCPPAFYYSSWIPELLDTPCPHTAPPHYHTAILLNQLRRYSNHAIEAHIQQFRRGKPPLFGSDPKHDWWRKGILGPLTPIAKHRRSINSSTRDLICFVVESKRISLDIGSANCSTMPPQQMAGSEASLPSFFSPRDHLITNSKSKCRMPPCCYAVMR